MNKILIIPSLNGFLKEAENIISDHLPDLTIFMGDYFSNRTDITNSDIVTDWFNINKSKPNRIYLIGDRDISFLFPSNRIISGNTFGEITKDYIYKHLKQEVLDKFKVFYYDAGSNTIFSHAGVNSKIFYAKDGKNFIESLSLHEKAAIEGAKSNAGNYPVWWEDTRANGRQVKKQGGFVGQSWDTLKPLRGYNQVVSSGVLQNPEAKFSPSTEEPRNLTININAPVKFAYGLIENNKIKTYVFNSIRCSHNLYQSYFL